MPAHADSWAKRPSLQARVARDPVSGWNLEIVTENFAFAPGAAGLASIPGEGHAHVYLNGEKIARVYGNWYHIASAPSGDILLRVSLNDNAHHPLYLDGEPIEVVLALPTD